MASKGCQLDKQLESGFLEGSFQIKHEKILIKQREFEAMEPDE